MDHSILKAELTALYLPCCDIATALPVAKLSGDIDDLLESLVKYVYETKGLGLQVDTKMIRHYAGLFWQGVKEGYGKDLTDFAEGSVDHRMLSAIRENVWQFSAAKNYSQLRALSNAVIGPDGKILTESEFKRAAYAINKEHVGPWLSAEYDLTITGGQMSSKWAKAQFDNVPLLEFDAVMDNHTTQTCRELNGTVKPPSDTFWDIYYPPNHFRERSTVRERYSGAITPSSSINYPEIPDMFRTNLAKNGLVFPPGHAYFNGLPEQVKQTADKLSKRP